MSCGVDAEVCAEMLERVCLDQCRIKRQCCEGLSSKFKKKKSLSFFLVVTATDTRVHLHLGFSLSTVF